VRGSWQDWAEKRLRGPWSSNFDRPHKVSFALFGTPIPGLERTEVAILYTGQSGLPFSYVYRGDINGDGYPSVGPATERNNDLLYVPETAIKLPASIASPESQGQAQFGVRVHW
jgi:hypothetical protein